MEKGKRVWAGRDKVHVVECTGPQGMLLLAVKRSQVNEPNPIIIHYPSEN